MSTARTARVPWIVGGVVVVALVAAIVASFGGSSDTPEGAEFGAPSVSGNALALLANPDPAIGQPMPEVRGAGFDGEAASIASDGRPKAIVLLAHWCSHCQTELPDLRAWLDGGGLPAGVDLVAVATGTTEARPNFPPSEWFAREGYSGPLIVDDAAGTVADAYGLTAFPFWVFTDGDGRVALRVEGALSMEDVSTVVNALAR